MTITEMLNMPKCMGFTEYEKLLEEKLNEFIEYSR